MLTNVGSIFGTSTYYSQRTKSNTGQSAVCFSSTASIHLHMNDPEGGDKAVTSVGFPDGTSASVYSAEGYSQYTVKYWNQNGDIKEYDYDADTVDAGNANYLEMLAFTSHLDITGQTSNAFGDFISAARGVNGDRTYNSENILARYDFRQMTEEFMNAQYRFGNMTGYLSVKNLYDHMISDIDATETSDISDNEVVEEQPLPGFGTALAGDMGYGMSASLVSTNSADDVIVRVKLAKGGGNSESIDVNLSEFNPRSATAIEMFAYCQYMDAMGEGSGHTWGSWNAIKKVISPADGMDFGSIENIMNEKRNWTGALAKSKTYMENPKTGETLSAADLLKMFEEQNKLTAEELKEGDDWRSMSDDDWDKLLSGVDKYIDAYKEDIRERVKKQMEAAQKAALEADPEMRSKAAQEAALSVAASGFDAGEGSEGEETAETTGDDPGIDHEKNWTRKLKTDDQTVLRAAKAAQAMENMALSRMEEIASAGVSAYESYSGMVSRYMRDRRFMNYA
ncbi:MAG: hypothetical protein SPL71_08105 [Oribacterium sp.]|nr:hypothetical protein [Oribacterium sp.]